MTRQDSTGLRRGLAILFALEGHDMPGDGELGVSAIATLIGREKSQVSRTLKTLTEYGLVERNPDTAAYRLGWRLLAMAERSTYSRLMAAAEPLLERLSRELGERAHLSVLQGTEVLTVLSRAPERSVQTAGWVGRSVPAYSTSAGRALLFDHEARELDSLFAGIEFERVTPRTPRDASVLHKRIVESRARGFALVIDEFELGLVAVGAPVRDFKGRIVAAVNLSAPGFRFADQLERAGREVKAAADELSGALGASPGRIERR